MPQFYGLAGVRLEKPPTRPRVEARADPQLPADRQGAAYQEMLCFVGSAAGDRAEMLSAGPRRAGQARRCTTNTGRS